MKQVVLVKLGGSLITNKSKPFKARRKTIKSLAKTLGQAVQENPGIGLVMGTGAGSYGHYPVVKYGLKGGAKTKSQLFGFSVVENGVKTLNAMVVSELIKQNVSAVGMHPSSMMVASGGEIKEFFSESLIGMLGAGIIPVVHGDIIFDEEEGSHIVSTEASFAMLVEKLLAKGYKVPRIIYATSSAGVIGKDNQMIPTISRGNYKEIANSLSGASGYDVTGGMRSKVDASLNLTDKGIETYIIDGRNGNNLLKAIRGERVGTVITFREDVDEQIEEAAEKIRQITED